MNKSSSLRSPARATRRALRSLFSVHAHPLRALHSDAVITSSQTRDGGPEGAWDKVVVPGLAWHRSPFSSHGLHEDLKQWVNLHFVE